MSNPDSLTEQRCLGCGTEPEPGPGEGSLAQRDRHLQPGLHEGEIAERQNRNKYLVYVHVTLLPGEIENFPTISRSNPCKRQQRQCLPDVRWVNCDVSVIFWLRAATGTGPGYYWWCLCSGTGRSTTFLTINLLTPRDHSSYCGVLYNNVSIC